MKIRILAVGRKASGWVADAEKDYLKRLSHAADISCDLITPEDEHSLGAQAAAAKESAGLLVRCKPGDFLIACDRRGKPCASEELAAALRTLQDRGIKICFVIGGSHGLTKEVLDKASLTVSFSHLTFPHELFRVMLLEQIYRAFTIISGKKYHK
jgi:23S rRNA (pseudouridine1915-N3)-methyltransferase